MTGAAMPMDEYEGSTPTRKVDRPMIRMVIRKVYLRPTMSPRRPKTKAPKGRTAKPAANASKAKIKPAVGLTPEKKCAAIMAARDRKSVVEGKRVSVSVDIGGRRIIKKKKHTERHIRH